MFRFFSVQLQLSVDVSEPDDDSVLKDQYSHQPLQGESALDNGVLSASQDLTSTLTQRSVEFRSASRESANALLSMGSSYIHPILIDWDN